MVKHRLVVNEGYASTLEETGGIYTLTSYHILQAENPLDPMEGVPVVTQVTVRNMQVDTEGNCSATATMLFSDQATNGVFAEGTVELMNQSEAEAAWSVSSSTISPIADVSLHNVNTGDDVVSIASAGVTAVGVETNEPIFPVGEVTSRELPSVTARSILFPVVEAVQTLTLDEPISVEYYPSDIPMVEGFSQQRSSDATEVMYSSSNAETFFTITDSRHQYAPEFGTIPGARAFNIQSGGVVWGGSVTLPIPAAEAQPRPFLSLLRDQNGVVAGIATTQLHIPGIAMKAPSVTVSRSTVSANLAAATASDLIGSLTFQKLTTKNLNA